MLTKNASSVELYGEFSRREPKNTTKQSASLRDAVTVRQPGLCYPTFDQGKAGPSRGKPGTDTWGNLRDRSAMDTKRMQKRRCAGNGSASKTSR